MPCVSDNEVAGLVDGTLDPSNRATAIAELTSCASCRALLHEALGLRATPSQDPAGGHVAVPAEIAGYELGPVLGAGSGGVVVRARDPVLARDVALKLVRATPATHALREARTLATVRHPAVVGVYATGTAADVDYVAMELVDGESLAARLARGPLPWRDALRWFADVAAGLSAIHTAGLVHRDVKPGNLLVDGDRLRIADFGLAARDPDAALAGTLPYMAPEVLGGAAADARSDLYSLFASLFETLTGARPYRELDRRALRAAAMHGEPMWPPGPRIPSRVRAIVERGLASDPAARFPDATAARTALLAGRRVSNRMRALAAAGAATVIATTAIAGASVIRDADACVAAPPSWTVAAVTASPARVPVLARARLLQYGDTLSSAIAGACRDDSPAGRARRACLAAADRRAGALVADPSEVPAEVVALERAVVALPDPAACNAWHLAPPWSPLDDAALAGARDAAAAGDVRRASAWIALVGPSSSNAGDAELVRGSLALAAADTKGAIAAFRSALDASATLGRDDLAIAANAGLAIAVGESDHQPAAGEAYAAAAFAIAQRTGDPRSIGTAQRYVGWLAHLGGDDARAVHELTTALEALTTAGASMEQSVAELDLGKIARAHGDYAGARAHVERAGVLRRTLLGPAHPDTVAIDADRASIDLVDGHAARAVALQRGIVARIATIYGDSHPALAGPLTNLGAALAASGDYVAAGDALMRALAIDRTRFGELDAQVADDYANLAGMRVVAGRYHDAVDLYRAAIAAARSALGDGHPLLARPYAQLAVALASLRDYPAATAALEHAIAIYRDHPGHDDELARALATRATLETGSSRGQDAQRDALEAVAILEHAHGAEHVALLPALSALAQAAYAVGDFAGSAGAAERSLAIRAHAGGTPRQTAETHLILANALWKLGRHFEALAAARQGLAELGTDDPALAAHTRAWIAHPT